MKKSNSELWIKIVFIIIMGLIISNSIYVKETPELTATLALEDRLRINALLCPNTINTLNSELTGYCHKVGFHGVVMVVERGDIIYNEAFGNTNFGKERIALQTDMPFQLASVSKQFTAAAIMKLKSDNLLNYDDVVTKYIVDFPYPDVTIRQLLNHTSGMGNYMYLLENVWHNDTIYPQNDTLMRLMAQYRIDPYFSPGMRFSYSNTGYVILASVVEAVSKQSFSDYMQTNFFKPLQMNETFLPSAKPDTIGNAVKGYIRSRRRYYTSLPSVHDAIVGDKGIYSTSWDMYKWDKSLYDYSILSPDVLDEAFTPSTVGNKKRTIPYGFGYRMKQLDGYDVIYHNGLWEGFRINYYRFPELKNTILVMNNNEFNIGSVTSKVRKIINNNNPENIECRFTIDCFLDGHPDIAGYAFAMAAHDNPEATDYIAIVRQKLWDMGYYSLYEEMGSAIQLTINN